ncbi:hypothetical protein QYF36_014099 [Acer negundo]|nr:hypothetical protein QYF36_014099 [Acer negundo]
MAKESFSSQVQSIIPGIIKKAKAGGLNVIQTCVFWNVHEPVQGQYHMKKFTKMIIDMMKEEKYLKEIENEYNAVQDALKESGTRYVQWAGTMVVGLKTGVPWINTCNGRNCGDTFPSPNKPNKPVLWTENWTAQYRVFGDPPSQRNAEDLVFSVACFFSKNGTLTNYYMYYGRSTTSFVTTRYYDEAPIDEYGLLREPKWGHLRDLHFALKLCKKALLFGTTFVEILGPYVEARIYEEPKSGSCAAFFSNNHSRMSQTATFRGTNYYLPQHSISILPDCKTVIYNTQTMMFQIAMNLSSRKRSLLPRELWSLTKDTTDYLWYTTSIELDRTDLPFRKGILPVLEVANLGHLMHVFVNGEYVASGRGTNIEKSFVLRKPITLKAGINIISLLGGTVGLPDIGDNLERRYAGVRSVAIQGLNLGTLDLTNNGWSHQVGLEGEKLRVYTLEGSHSVKWKKADSTRGAITWYKAYFDEPKGNDPLAIELATMSKGMVWINGKSIRRYWVSYHSSLGRPSQSLYHIPRAFVKPRNNLLVLFEEMGGNIDGVEMMITHRNTICSFIDENHLARVSKWKKEDSFIRLLSPMPKNQLP